MDIKRVVLRPFETNCYIINSLGETAVIDPGSDADRIMGSLEAGNKLKYIILTHGHFDHIMAAEEIKNKTGCKILVHNEDKDMLLNGNLSLAARFGVEHVSASYDKCIDDGDTLSIGELTFKVISTPGHTMGSISLLCNDVLFSGDTLFRETIGNFQRKDKAAMMGSVKKLLELDESIKVYPGHGEATTIKHEKNNNPYADFGWEWE